MKRSRKDKSYVSRQNAELKYLQVQLEHHALFAPDGQITSPLQLWRVQPPLQK
jgi:hypothetical protein